MTTGLALFTAGCLLLIPFPAHKFLLIIRCLGLLVLAIAGLRSRSLTFWIFFAMLAGLELGLDAPAFASQLRFLSDIFLRLIKVIVAPLILGTLITGIAGHGDLRKVGRIGWKSLVYFEAVTTIAFFSAFRHQSDQSGRRPGDSRRWRLSNPSQYHAAALE